ncbi:sensor histidine kinase [Aminobacter sp. MET-1]|uniref:sensor histidine kinase n=1 Tax=Aminobacter sp. MET-1 TaxID=2951085 RepID=UPI00226A9B82|nr:sensor histidine kinase [Aminobacter sp. MET-1]MCX8571092.1 sensor histidine kinase [Aminobacter sp. MET-1]MCX8573239.1 sensor histidine kinase [Aminobacter sp. MET-1]
MKLPKLASWLVIPYVGLVLAAGLGAWSYFQSEQYRLDTEEILTQTYEIQWRVAQVRERIIRVAGYLQIADKTGDLEPDIRRQLGLIDVNVKQLLKLPYVVRFLPPREVRLLEALNTRIDTEVTSTIENRQNYAAALATMKSLEQEMFEISSATVNHSATLHQKTQIDIGASRNWYYFGVALGLVAICSLALHQRYALKERDNKQLRSMAVLYQHMTHTRISALRLFIESLTGRRRPSTVLIDAARRAATELETINGSLTAIACAKRDYQPQPLGDVLELLTQNGGDKVSIDVDEAARDLPIPSTLFMLLLGELVENARTAINGRPNGQVAIRAQVKPSTLWRSKELNLEVMDNGEGMSPEVLSKADTPFFSTKSGRHMGLGLTSCAEIVETLRGSLRLDSVLQKGTIVRIRLPINAKETATQAVRAAPSASAAL